MTLSLPTDRSRRAPTSPLDRVIPVDRVPVAYLAVCAVLALAGNQSRVLAMLVAGAVLLAVAVTVVFSKRVELLVAGVGLVVASEPLWRMTKSRAPWEVGKYVLIVGFGIACFRFASRHLSVLPLVFIGLLIPSCFITLTHSGLSKTWGTVVFSVGGGVALGVAVFFLQRVVATGEEMTQQIWVIIGPLFGIAVVVARRTMAAGQISFTDNSNFDTSGGYGPNQVSLVLGLGALLCLLILLRGIRGRAGLFVLVLCGFFFGQTLLTFSRGGVYTAVVGAAGVVLAGLMTSGTRSKVLSRALLIGIMALLVVSWVSTFTGGTLGTRYADQRTTGRTDIAASEVRLFQQNLVLGVGPGQRSTYSETGIEMLDSDASHTEYTRLLAEHGLFGLAAIGVLVAMAWRAFRSQTDRWGRLFAAGCIFWAMMAMTHAGMRIGLIALVFALASIKIRPGATSAASVSRA
jgi:hypothetical protein